MMRKAAILLLFFLIAAAAEAEPYAIAVVKSGSLPIYDEAVTGIRQAVEAKGIQADFSDYDLEESIAEQVIAGLRRQKPNLILTVGYFATRDVAASIQDIPIVFSMVLNPVSTGLLPDLETSGRNMTGVTLNILTNERLSAFRSVVLNLKKVGVLYSPAESGPMVERTKKSAAQIGTTVVPIAVEASKDVLDKVEKLNQLDGLLMISDSVVYTSRTREYILAYTTARRIPTMTISERYLQEGALVALLLDYPDLYLQTAEKMDEVLRGGDPATLKIARPRKTILALNLKTAETMGIKIPADVMKQAGVVYK